MVEHQNWRRQMTPSIHHTRAVLRANQRLPQPSYVGQWLPSPTSENSTSAGIFVLGQVSEAIPHLLARMLVHASTQPLAQSLAQSLAQALAQSLAHALVHPANPEFATASACVRDASGSKGAF